MSSSHLNRPFWPEGVRIVTVFLVGMALVASAALTGCGGQAPSSEQDVPVGQAVPEPGETAWDAEVVSVNGETAVVELLETGRYGLSGGGDRVTALNGFPGLMAGDRVTVKSANSFGLRILSADSEPGSRSARRGEAVPSPASPAGP